MGSNLTDNDTFHQLFAPLNNTWGDAEHQYKCHKLSDEDWIKAGVVRVLDDLLFLNNC